MINFNAFNINTNGRTSGRMKTFCPECHDRRRDKRDKSLSVNLDNGLAYCHYCDWKVNANVREKKTFQKYTPPQPAVLRDAHVDWFKKERGILSGALIAAGITSAEEYIPQTKRKESCICFNYYEGDRLVNTKFRTLDKLFKFVTGKELIPYNINGILGEPQCIFVEGELDALSFFEIGRTDVISVPNGANTNLSWMDRFVESHFEDKKVIYICVDTDRKGQELRDELVRRLGAERCRIVDLSPAKDANEVLCLPDGRNLLRQALEKAPMAPLEGVYGAEDIEDELLALFENGLGKGADTGWENLDALCTFELGRLCVITGVPGCGKSEFVDELVLRLNLRHHWKAAFFSPENMPLSYHVQKLSEKLIGKGFHKGLMTPVEYRSTVSYLQENIVSILPKEDFTADNILLKARELVHRRGIRLLILDPYNALEHRIPAGMTETQYISAFLDSLKNFAIRNRCLVILVAHPHKMHRDPVTNRSALPDLYNINGSAAFNNKCDFGLIVERNREAKVTRVHVKKVKFRHLGDQGTASYVYNQSNGRFCECEEKEGLSGNVEFQFRPFDNSSWLREEVQEPAMFGVSEVE